MINIPTSLADSITGTTTNLSSLLIGFIMIFIFAIHVLSSLNGSDNSEQRRQEEENHQRFLDKVARDEHTERYLRELRVIERENFEREVQQRERERFAERSRHGSEPNC